MKASRLYLGFLAIALVAFSAIGQAKPKSTSAKKATKQDVEQRLVCGTIKDSYLVVSATEKHYMEGIFTDGSDYPAAGPFCIYGEFKKGKLAGYLDGATPPDCKCGAGTTGSSDASASQ